MASHRLILAAAVLVCLAARGQGTSSVGSQGIRTLRQPRERSAGLSLYRTDAEEHITLEEVAKQLRSRRQSNGGPTPHGEHLFSGDSNRYARIYYSGNTSSVILLLTYNNIQNPSQTNLYRSTNYGESFENIGGNLGSPLWSNFYASDLSKLVVFYHSTRPVIYVSEDEGTTWTTTNLSPNTIDPRSFVWNPREERSAIAHDRVNNFIYVTQDLGQTWIKIAENVRNQLDYQWGNRYDSDQSLIYYNSYDPNDARRGDYTVGLYSQRSPYTKVTRKEVDPDLGRHDYFNLIGPYIFAQRNDSGYLHLYISYLRQPFKRAKIPSTEDPHAGYIVAHINELQALVIVQHTSGKYNLYLSDITGVYFSLSLEDLVVINRQTVDLEVIRGINGTMIANRHELINGSTTVIRTMVTLDNGGEWNYVTPPEVDLGGAPVLCEPPSCSLHFHMDSSQYARLGVYSQESAPGIIMAHGNIGSQLADNPDLYISRDGGVSWYQTLAGSWGVTVVDHGGLLVAADDYHKDPSMVLKYSCDEGLSWNDYTYTTTEMTVFGVITEPGEETTTVSLYGIKRNIRAWDVVTIDFSSIFTTNCTSGDFYPWQPWDARSDTDCILGLDVTLERRFPQACCLIGPNYDRPVSARVCQCSIDDYECDYGFMPADGVDGPCVRDASVPLDDPCADSDAKTVMKSRGYRKIAGDICISGDLVDFEPYEFTCCNSSGHGNGPVDGLSSDGGQSVVTGLAVSLAVALLVVLFLAAVLVVIVWKRKLRWFRLFGRGSSTMHFRSITNTSDESGQLLGDDDDDDDLPLAI